MVHIGSAALNTSDNPLLLEGSERLTHGLTADTEKLGVLRLRRHAASVGVPAVLYVLQNVGHYGCLLDRLLHILSSLIHGTFDSVQIIL